MPALTLGDRTIEVSGGRVSREADRMFRMSPERRKHRVDTAKRRLAAAAKEVPERSLEKLAALLLSQGVNKA
jgi:hypothetical protein